MSTKIDTRSKAIEPYRAKAWVVGQSGNPNGRPKGTKNRATIYKEMFSFKIKDLGRDDLQALADKFNLPTNATIQQLITAQHLALVASKREDISLRAIEMANDSAFGKPVQPSAVLQETVINTSELSERIKRLKEMYRSDF
jgi:hypothetical protein